MFKKKKTSHELCLNIIQGFITKYRTERESHSTNLFAILKITLSRVSQPAEDVVIKAKLLSVTHNVQCYYQKPHTGELLIGEEGKKRGSLVTLTHESSSQYFVSHYFL